MTTYIVDFGDPPVPCTCTVQTAYRTKDGTDVRYGPFLGVFDDADSENAISLLIRPLSLGDVHYLSLGRLPLSLVRRPLS